MTNLTLIATADPDFADLAQEELSQALPNARTVVTLAPGVWGLATASRSFFDLATHWQPNPPIFIRHVNPVQAETAVTNTGRDVATLDKLLRQELLALVDPELPFSVQTRLFGNQDYKPYDVNKTLSTTIREAVGAPLNVRDPVQVLSAVVGRGQGYLGLSPAAHNLSDWAGGKRRFAREKEQISRAEFKLLEALEVFAIELPPRGVALDLGAAPGGWTRVLRQKEQYVTAVDPADLHPSLQADPNVRHLRTTAEDYLTHPPDQFDLIANDMRVDARDSSRLMAEYAPFLYRHGRGLITLKLPADHESAGGRRAVIDHSFNILGDAYTIAGARQLFHNRSEITVYLRAKP